MRKLLCVGMAVLLLLMTGCKKEEAKPLLDTEPEIVAPAVEPEPEPEPEPVPTPAVVEPEPTPEPEEVILQEIAFDILDQLYETENSVVLSPLSLKYALAMLMNYGDEALQKEIGDRVFPGTSMNSINNWAGSQDTYLSDMENVTVKTANSLWISQEVSGMDQDVVNSLMNFYRAQIGIKDFRAEGAEKEINDWVALRTENLIPNIIESIEPDQMLLLINALYLKAGWGRVFDSLNTKVFDFTTASGDKVPAGFMTDTREVQAMVKDGIQSIILPYANEELKAVFIMPTSGSLGEYISKMNMSTLQDILYNGEMGEYEIQIPLVHEEVKYDLIEPLKAYGITRMFDKADSGLEKAGTLGNDKPFVNLVLQKTYLDINEAGTEAAAVTAIGIMDNAMAIEEEKPEILKFDRPFIVTIMDSREEILFIGAINKVEEFVAASEGTLEEGEEATELESAAVAE